MRLRLTYFKHGKEVSDIWDFQPLRDKRQAPQYLRDDRTSSDGRLLRRPYGEQNVRLITFGAGLILAGTDGADKFLLLQRAHKIEISDDRGKTWAEYVPDLTDQIELSLLEDIDELAYCEIKFIEAQARYFADWYPK